MLENLINVETLYDKPENLPNVLSSLRHYFQNTCTERGGEQHSLKYCTITHSLISQGIITRTILSDKPYSRINPYNSLFMS